MSTTYSAGLLQVGTLNVSTGSQGTINAATINATTINATNVNPQFLGLQNLNLVGDLAVAGNSSVAGTAEFKEGINPPTMYMELPGDNGSWKTFQGTNHLNQQCSNSCPLLTAASAADLAIFRSTRIPSGYTQCSGWWHMICDDFYVYQLVLTCTTDQYSDNGSTGLSRFELVKYDRFTGAVVLSTLNNTNMWKGLVDASGSEIPDPRMKNIFGMNGEYLYFSSSTPNQVQGIIKVNKNNFNIEWTCSDPCGVYSIAHNNNLFMNPIWSHGIFAVMGIKHLMAVPYPNPDSDPVLAKQTILIFGTSTFDQYFTNAWDLNVRDIFTDRFSAILQQGHVFAMLDDGSGDLPTQMWDFPLGPRILVSGDELPDASFRDDQTTDLQIAYAILYGPKDITGVLIDSVSTSTDSSGNINGGVDGSGAYFTFGLDTSGVHVMCSFDHDLYDSIYLPDQAWTPDGVDPSGNDVFTGFDVSGNALTKVDFTAGLPVGGGFTLVYSGGLLVDPYMFPKTYNPYLFTGGQTIRNDSTVYTSIDGSGTILGSDIFIGQNVVKRMARGRILNAFDAFACNYWGSGGYGVSSYDADSGTIYYPCTNAQLTPYEDYLQVFGNTNNMNVRERNETYCGDVETAMDASGSLTPEVIDTIRGLLDQDASNVYNADKMSPRWKRQMAGSTLALDIITGELKWHYTNQAFDSFMWGGGLDWPGHWPAYESLGNNNDNIAGLSIQVDASGNHNGFMCPKNGTITVLSDLVNSETEVTAAATNAAYYAADLSGNAAAIARYESMCIEGIQTMTTPMYTNIFNGMGGAASGGGAVAGTNGTHYCSVNNNEPFGSVVFTPGANYTGFGFVAVPFSTEFEENQYSGLVVRNNLLKISEEVAPVLFNDVGTDSSGFMCSIIPTGTRFVVGVNCTTLEVDWITPLQQRPPAIVGLFPFRYTIENSGCTMSEELVIVGSGQLGALNILNSATGEVVKIIELPESTDGSAIAVGNVIYLGGGSVRWFNFITNPTSAGKFMRMITLNGQ